MSLKSIIYTVLLCFGMVYWFWNDLNTSIDYSRHSQLVDLVTGKKSKPSDLFDLSKILNYTDQYIEQTNSQERLYNLQYLINFESPIPIDQSYSKREDLRVSGWPVSNQTECGKQLKWIQSKLGERKDYTLVKGRLGYELTNYIDSFGKPESGFYSGVSNWVGSYKQCLKTSLDGGQIKTRYCIGRFRSKLWPKNETIYPKTSIRVGLCVPETCDSQSFPGHNAEMEAIAKTDLAESFRKEFELDSVFCLPDERSPIRKMPTAGYIYLSIVFGWIMIVLVVSIIHELRLKEQRESRRESIGSTMRLEIDETSKNVQISILTPVDFQKGLEIQKTNPQQRTIRKIADQLILALAIRCSIKSFKTDTFKLQRKSGERVRVHLGAIDFFKVFMAFSVVFAHSAYLGSIYSRSIRNRIDMNIDGLGKLALSLSRCVDIFFLFFGVLTSYTLLRKFSIKQLASPLNWFMINLGIFCRVSPMFILFYWYSKSVSPYTGSGPWWDYGVDKYSMKGVCMADPWWRSIPYLGSYGTPAVPSCNLPSWFIVTYTQLSLLLPLITYLICILPKFTHKLILIAFLTITSATNVGLRLFNQTSIREEGFTLYGGFLSDLLEKFESTGHLSTLGRTGSVSIGCLIGFLLHQYETKKIKQWPNWLTNKFTIISAVLIELVIIAAPIIGHYIYLYTGRLVSTEEFVISHVILNLVFPALLSILVINITTVYNCSIIVRFFSHSFWHIFNRLGLCIFLSHWEIIFVGITGNEQAPGYGFVSELTKMWAFGAYLSTIIAFLVHILIEIPLTNLTTLVIKCFMPIAKQNQELPQQNSAPENQLPPLLLDDHIKKYQQQ